LILTSVKTTGINSLKKNFSTRGQPSLLKSLSLSRKLSLLRRPMSQSRTRNLLRLHPNLHLLLLLLPNQRLLALLLITPPATQAAPFLRHLRQAPLPHLSLLSLHRVRIQPRQMDSKTISFLMCRKSPKFLRTCGDQAISLLWFLKASPNTESPQAMKRTTTFMVRMSTGREMSLTWITSTSSGASSTRVSAPPRPAMVSTLRPTERGWV